MKFLTASPDRGATLPSKIDDKRQLLRANLTQTPHKSFLCDAPNLQHPSEIAICNPVPTRPLPLAGIFAASEAYRS